MHYQRPELHTLRTDMYKGSCSTGSIADTVSGTSCKPGGGNTVAAVGFCTPGGGNQQLCALYGASDKDLCNAGGSADNAACSTGLRVGQCVTGIDVG